MKSTIKLIKSIFTVNCKILSKNVQISNELTINMTLELDGEYTWLLLDNQSEYKPPRLSSILRAAHSLKANIIYMKELIDQNEKKELEKRSISYIEERTATGKYFSRSMASSKKLQESKEKRMNIPASPRLQLYLLEHPKDVNLSFSELANKVGVSKVVIHKIFTNDFQKMELIKPLLHGKRGIFSPERNMIKRLVNDINLKYRSRFSLGQFKVSMSNNEIFNICKKNKINIVFGGDYAAMEMGLEIRPTVFDIYIEENDLRKIISQLRLKRSSEGNLYINKKFWDFEYQYEKSRINIAPPLIIAADLFYKGDPRSEEVAEKILKKFYGKK
ncbi:type IV toxin-antitoxin system AbiEi family antitoxin [Halobacteriovorax marinus]|uniref:type IV toxin-antitoxin system AbiEi family antitoxin n=1 Tax=Halobacteriovorax marinus TaxID=97084 RepID=UPI003A9167F6